MWNPRAIRTLSQAGLARTPAVEMQMQLRFSWKQLIASIADSQRTMVEGRLRGQTRDSVFEGQIRDSDLNAFRKRPLPRNIAVGVEPPTSFAIPNLKSDSGEAL